MAERGECNAFLCQIIDEYLDMLFRIAFLHTKTRADAEDVVQDVLLKLLKKPPVFENQAHEKAWLIKVVTNQSRDFLKTAWLKRSRPLPEDIPAPAPAEKNEIIQQLMELPAMYREVVLLYYYEGYNIGEIAQMLGRKESTIGSQLHRARSMLRIVLTEEDGNARI